MTTPLPHLDAEGAFALQQRIVAAICDELPGDELFRADVGVKLGLGRPHTTARVERVLARTFDAEDACLVQGAGTGAIRAALSAGPWRDGQRRLLAHDAPDYSTTATTFRDGLVEAVRVDLNDPEAVDAALKAPDSPAWVYIQHTRQRLADSFDPIAVVERAHALGKRVIVDENYAAVRTPRLGVQVGAAASTFSLFKLHGPEGVGVVVGDADLCDAAHAANYSGGGQVQGPQAVAALQSLVSAPLNWARQSKEVHRLARLLRDGAVHGIADAVVANVQDLCVVALLDTPVADDVRARASRYGAAPYPVGSNSRYEIAPMIYRLSSSTLDAQPELREWTLRINPMRAGADLTADILSRALRG
ncbi:aminotransferase class V-fold PLP-dependent enzyme [Xylanimonas ulmi]|uniref:aminotransferase class V-fold PLP-dependent enzyme n=1 Tax=Xylanimonas ulmi TaxID=228973 RepID=UPI001A911CE1|nr:aminotransferase class V-fold PLP-dependent enzyme [Xylanibacterium ulmi]